jgi:hypothetical protein
MPVAYHNQAISMCIINTLAYSPEKTETKKKSLTKVIPVANVIKLFTAVSYDFS